MTLLKPLSAIFAKDAKKGAETTIFCAVNDDVPKNNGAYYRFKNLENHKFVKIKIILNYFK